MIVTSTQMIARDYKIGRGFELTTLKLQIAADVSNIGHMHQLWGPT